MTGTMSTLDTSDAPAVLTGPRRFGRRRRDHAPQVGPKDKPKISLRSKLLIYLVLAPLANRIQGVPQHR
jgi:hypothetical protein